MHALSPDWPPVVGWLVGGLQVLDKEKIQKQNMGAQIKKEISIMKMIRHR